MKDYKPVFVAGGAAQNAARAAAVRPLLPAWYKPSDPNKLISIVCPAAKISGVHWMCWRR